MFSKHVQIRFEWRASLKMARSKQILLAFVYHISLFSLTLQVELDRNVNDSIEKTNGQILRNDHSQYEENLYEELPKH